MRCDRDANIIAIILVLQIHYIFQIFLQSVGKLFHLSSVHWKTFPLFLLLIGKLSLYICCPSANDSFIFVVFIINLSLYLCYLLTDCPLYFSVHVQTGSFISTVH
jgi:hypothetical protein